MNRIELHIENLLLSHDCVIVPGLGGFVTRFEESFISEDTQEILPPYRSVSFNSQLRANDGLLTQSYMTIYDTNYPKAQSMVEEDSRQIRELLHANGEYQFGSLGKVQLTQSGALIFTPSDKNGIAAIELYGLVQCRIPVAVAQQVAETPTKPIEIMEEKQTDIQPVALQPEATPVDKPVHNEEVEQIDDQKKDNKHYVIRLSKNTVHYAVAAVAAILLYFVFTISPSMTSGSGNVLEAAIFGGSAQPEKQVAVKKEQQHVVATPKVEVSKTVAEVEPQEKPVVTSNVATTEPETIVKEEQQSVLSQVAKPATTTSYTIVLASAISMKGANLFVDKLHKSGLYQARISKKGNMTRVTYASFTTQADAYKALSELRSENSNFASAWVMAE